MPRLKIQNGTLVYNSKYSQMWVAQEEHGKMISLKSKHMKCLKSMQLTTTVTNLSKWTAM